MRQWTSFDLIVAADRRLRRTTMLSDICIMFHVPSSIFSRAIESVRVSDVSLKNVIQNAILRSPNLSPSQIMEENVTYVKAQCHCGITSFLAGFDNALLPFDVSLCSCNDCRHVTGQMTNYSIPMKTSLIGTFNLRRPDITKATLTAYRVNESTVRYFCPTCSSHILRNVEGKGWFVAGGALESVHGLVKLSSHCNVAETMDGGIADQLPYVNGRRLARYAHDIGSEELPMHWRDPQLGTSDPRTADTLDAYCHCGGINLKITRPNALSTMPSAPYPDLLYPKSTSRLATIRNPRDEKWWLSPSMQMRKDGRTVTSGAPPLLTIPTAGTRYLAGHCVRWYCSQGFGFDVQSWAFISRANIFPGGGEDDSEESERRPPINLAQEELRIPALKQYSTSPGKYHEFCRTCGATAFWWHVDRQDVLDMSVGLINQQIDGVRAEGWLKWHAERLSFVEDAGSDSAGAIEGLASGMLAHQAEKMASASQTGIN